MNKKTIMANQWLLHITNASDILRRLFRFAINPGFNCPRNKGIKRRRLNRQILFNTLFLLITKNFKLFCYKSL